MRTPAAARASRTERPALIASCYIPEKTNVDDGMIYETVVHSYPESIPIFGWNISTTLHDLKDGSFKLVVRSLSDSTSDELIFTKKIETRLPILNISVDCDVLKTK
jgi:hypothetical protein